MLRALHFWWNFEPTFGMMSGVGFLCQSKYQVTSAMEEKLFSEQNTPDTSDIMDTHPLNHNNRHAYRRHFLRVITKCSACDCKIHGESGIYLKNCPCVMPIQTCVFHLNGFCIFSVFNACVWCMSSVYMIEQSCSSAADSMRLSK